MDNSLCDEELRRLSWRCRRGLLELDIILQRFSEHYLSGLSTHELVAFDSLLDLPDNEFLDVVTSRKEFTSRTGLISDEDVDIECIDSVNNNLAAMQQVLTKLRSNSN